MKEEAEHQGLSFTEDSPCPYFDDGRIATIEYLFGGDADLLEFDSFLSEGYRRLGSVLYHNRCAGCSACRPLRVDLGRFVPSRSQRRTLLRNRDIRIACFTPAFISEEKVDLYRRYLLSKHGDTDRKGHDFGLHLSHIHYGYSHTIEMDYFLGERLVGVGIVDESAGGLSSNYFYYDTEFLERRLGVFSILLEIRLAQQMGKHHHYLGYCIGETEKMAYKRFFRPNQILEAGVWRAFLE